MNGGKCLRMLLGDLHRKGRICDWIDNQFVPKTVRDLDYMEYVSSSDYQNDYAFDDDDIDNN